MVLTKTKENTAFKVTVRNLMKNVFILDNDRKHLAKKEKLSLSNNISVEDMNNALDDITNMYFVPNVLFQEDSPKALLPINNGTMILHEYDIYDRKTALRRLSRDIKHRSVIATTMFNSPLTFDESKKSKYQIKFNRINPDNTEYLGDAYDEFKAQKNMKYVKLDKLDNIHIQQLDNANQIIAILSDCIILSKRTLRKLTSKNGLALFPIAHMENEIQNCLDNTKKEQLSKQLTDKLMNINSKSPLYPNVQGGKEDWQVGLTVKLLAKNKKAYQNMLADRGTYDNYDLQLAKEHIQELEDIKEHGYKYSYKEIESDDKYYPLAKFIINFIEQAF